MMQLEEEDPTFELEAFASEVDDERTASVILGCVELLRERHSQLKDALGTIDELEARP